MQLKFVSLALSAAVVMTAVGASNDGANGNNWAVGPFGKAQYRDYYSGYPSGIEGAPPQKRDPSASKKFASAIRRRRALSRRDEEAGEEDEEQISTQVNSTEAKEEDVTTIVDDLDENTENTEEETSEDIESKNSEWERRSSAVGSLPVLGSVLGGSQSTGEGSGGLLGVL